MTKTKTIPYALLLAVLAVHPEASSAQRVAPVDHNQAISFYPVAELTKPATLKPSLQGARLADPKDWPASFYSVHRGGSCTSTLIGNRTLLTAAHCTPNGAAVTITLGGRTYNGKCTRSELYSPSAPDKDWALCLMDQDVPVKRYETVNADAARLKVKGELLLTGFGCTTSAGTGGNDGFYRIGEATITKLPTNTSADIFTSGEAALCYGDSGGGAFLFLDAAKKNRVQVSVNSRIEVLPNDELTKNSFLSSLSTTEAQSFLKDWATKNKASICGIHADAKNCR